MLQHENCLQIRQNTIVSYRKFARSARNLEAQKQLTSNLLRINAGDSEHKTYSGLLKPGTKKRLTKAIEMLVQSAEKKWVVNPKTGKQMPFRLSFMTLTVHNPGRVITGKEAHKNLLEPFLQWMRRQHNCYTYVWKAEHQKRGQIHYHITSTAFIHYKEIKDKWNSLNKKHGYLDKYFKKKGHYNAPSTQMKSVRKIKNIAEYLKKEMAKSYQNSKSIDGKVWDCSTNIKEIQYFNASGDKYAGRIFKMLADKTIQAVYTDHCAIYKTGDLEGFELLDSIDRFLYREHIAYLRNTQLVRTKKVKTDHTYRPPPKIIDIIPQLSLFSSS